MALIKLSIQPLNLNFKLVLASDKTKTCYSKMNMHVQVHLLNISTLKIGPHSEKTCLRGFPTRSYPNQSPEQQSQARKLKFHLLHVKI